MLVLEGLVLLTQRKIVRTNLINNIVLHCECPFGKGYKITNIYLISSFTAKLNIHFFAFDSSPWIIFCFYTVFSWNSYLFTCHYGLDFLRWNAIFQWTAFLATSSLSLMIFFKFSGISLVSVGRVRPGNEIKSKWWMLFFKGKRKPCCYDRSSTELSWILITWKLSLWTAF